ncbi:mechanosensitive ion channel family protein [Marinobacter sp. AN1]|uniref:mechanosensitive ion channel family protein n=1 Tax=Marinobacter sp. AN1 TaxID=2886046 RepID=UPI00222EA8B6|nr:mechanosensitive ion channel family protein [Marinobacter sp. AN1]UZD66872.1 mechanosensitive ion channel family protein [Marinobacter sp. AN1]
MLEQIPAAIAELNLSMPALRLLGTTVALLLIVLVVRAVLSKVIRTSIQSTELRRKWLVQTRNGLILVFLLGLVLIWGQELRTLALSIVAIAVAFVVATKELILCFMGSLVKGGARSFDIGDRIQVKDFRGDVIDQNLLATTILEVGPGKLTHQRTGRATVIPNSLFVSEPVINESFTEDYVLHVFTVPFKRDDNWQLAQKVLLDATQAQCEPFLETARRYMRRLGDRRGLEVPVVDPRVSLQVPLAGEIHLVVRFPCRPSQRSAIEQAILMEAFANNDFSGVRKKGSEEDQGPIDPERME